MAEVPDVLASTENQFLKDKLFKQSQKNKELKVKFEEASLSLMKSHNDISINEKVMADLVNEKSLLLEQINQMKLQLDKSQNG